MVVRRSRLLRYAVALVVICTVAALPAIAAARPGPADRDETAAQVLAAVRASSHRGYSGYAESHGDAQVPNVAQLGDVPSLLGDTTRLRIWWSSPTQWRVDQLGTDSENDVYGYPGGSWEWASATRTATDVTSVSPVRLPRPPDLTPDRLGRLLASLAAVSPAQVTRIGARRYAGRTALGIRLTGTAATTVASVEIWADEATGVPLAVEVTARGQSRPTISTSYMSFDASPPKTTTTTFLPPPDSTVKQGTDASLRGLLGRLRPFVAPPSVVGLPSTQGIPGQSGIATYGAGLARLAVVALSRGDGAILAAALARVAKADGDLTTVTTPLVNIALFHTSWRALLVTGSVPLPTLVAAVGELRHLPSHIGEPG